MITKQYQALVVFDLDGTLLRGFTVCEVLAEALDRLPRLRELERLRERQDIVAAREEMALWYRDTARESLLKTLDRSQRAPGFFEGMSLLHSCDVAVGIASITWDFAVSHFAQQLSVEHYLATRLQDSGAIDHVWPEEKAR